MLLVHSCEWLVRRFLFQNCFENLLGISLFFDDRKVTHTRDCSKVLITGSGHKSRNKGSQTDSKCISLLNVIMFQPTTNQPPCCWSWRKPDGWSIIIIHYTSYIWNHMEVCDTLFLLSGNLIPPFVWLFQTIQNNKRNNNDNKKEKRGQVCYHRLI